MKEIRCIKCNKELNPWNCSRIVEPRIDKGYYCEKCLLKYERKKISEDKNEKTT